MKKTISIILLFFGTIVFSRTFAEDTNSAASSCEAEISIRLKEPAKEIKTNEPVVLLIRFKNSSTNEAFLIYKVNGTIYDPSYSFIVTSPSGKNISPDMTKVQPGDSGILIIVPPNQMKELTFNLSRLCKFDEVGVYKIIAKKEILLSDKRINCEVTSNPLKIVIN